MCSVKVRKYNHEERKSVSAGSNIIRLFFQSRNVCDGLKGFQPGSVFTFDNQVKQYLKKNLHETVIYSAARCYLPRG